MKNVFTIIKKEFARFFKDKRMVITVLLPGLLIYLVYSVMGAVFSDSGKTDANYKYSAYVVNSPANEQFLTAFYTVSEIKEFASLDEAKKSVADGKLDIVVVFLENFDAVLEGDLSTVPNVEVYYNSSAEKSVGGYMAVTAILEAFKDPSFSIN